MFSFNPKRRFGPAGPVLVPQPPLPVWNGPLPEEFPDWRFPNSWEDPLAKDKPSRYSLQEYMLNNGIPTYGRHIELNYRNNAILDEWPHEDLGPPHRCGYDHGFPGHCLHPSHRVQVTGGGQRDEKDGFSSCRSVHGSEPDYSFFQDRFSNIKPPVYCPPSQVTSKGKLGASRPSLPANLGASRPSLPVNLGASRLTLHKLKNQKNIQKNERIKHWLESQRGNANEKANASKSSKSSTIKGSTLSKKTPSQPNKANKANKNKTVKENDGPVF